MSKYEESSFITLDWNEHIRKRSGMYIGDLGDGSSPEDGLYVLIKEVIDNSIDEYAAGFGKKIEININEDNYISIRDYGRGIPLEVLVDAASKMNTGAKFDNSDYTKSVGLNGVGLKAVNATSSSFIIQAFRDGKSKKATFSRGELLSEENLDTKEKNGTKVTYLADDEIFKNYSYNLEFIEDMIKNYSYLNIGLILVLNGKEYKSTNGLLDLVNNEMCTEEPLYPPIHLVGEDIEIVLTHGSENGENIASFVNGQNTTRGGTHLSAYRESVAKVIKEYFNKDYEPNDIRQSIIGAISIRIQEPKFNDQPKTILGSKYVDSETTVRSFIGDFLKENLDNYLHMNREVASVIEKKVKASEKERKAISVITKSTKNTYKKASLHNKKLRDCRVHYTDIKKDLHEESTLFITEGDSASGSITKSRNANTQAVFSLRGKPLNSFQKSEKDVYKNEELILLKAALNIEEDMDNLRYNKIVIATDADVDGMHIRLLLITFFLKYYPDLIRQGHVFILQTPLFRVRNKKETKYCYNEDEKQTAIQMLKSNIEITRFKGLGEISPKEFEYFIGENMRLDPVKLSPDENITKLLRFYMGNNTPQRQDFITNNLKSDAIIEN
ncbi:MAG: DNA topoisomerase IV subunit B [Bacteroidales bacterium]